MTIQYQLKPKPSFTPRLYIPQWSDVSTIKFSEQLPELQKNNRLKRFVPELAKSLSILNQLKMERNTL